LRRRLRPAVWVVLEEVALDAVVEHGRLVARTSARQVAERLGINPGTAADALRVLSRLGLVSLEREKGPAGRFGLSVYQLGSVTGLSLVQPCAVSPGVVSPSLVPPASDASTLGFPRTAAAQVESPRLDCSDSGPDNRENRTACDPDRCGLTPDDSPTLQPGCFGDSSQPPAPAQPRASAQCPEQESFDLGSVSS
jgi:hypothetical protein